MDEQLQEEKEDQDVIKNRLASKVNLLMKGTDNEWWERKPVVFSFSDAKVREKMVYLMGTDVVRITDRLFMRKLEDRMHAVYREEINSRIKEREEREKNKHRKLMLDGVEALYKVDSQLSKHPMIRVRQRVENAMLDLQLKEELKSTKRHVPHFDYSIFKEDQDAVVEEEEEVSEEATFTEDSSLHMDFVTQEKEHCHQVLEEELDEDYLFDEEEYERRRYEYPKVKEMKNIETVDELYKIAEEILYVKHLEPEPIEKQPEEEVTSPTEEVNVEKPEGQQQPGAEPQATT